MAAAAVQSDPFSNVLRFPDSTLPMAIASRSDPINAVPSFQSNGLVTMSVASAETTAHQSPLITGSASVQRTVGGAVTQPQPLTAAAAALRLANVQQQQLAVYMQQLQQGSLPRVTVERQPAALEQTGVDLTL